MAIKHRRLKLTGQRTKWVQGRNVSLRGTPTRINPQTVRLYAEEVGAMVDAMHKDISGQILKLFDTPTARKSIQKTEEVKSLVGAGMVTTAMDASIGSMSIALTNKLIAKWTKRFDVFGERWTSKMIAKTEKSSSKDLGRSLDKLSGGLSIDTSQINGKTRDKILASADQASSLIKTIGPQYASYAKEVVARSITDSSSSIEELQKTIHSMLDKKYKSHKNKAINVAKDQIKKTYTNITSSRMQDAGVDTYIWRHAGGVKKPRCLHRDVLNGQTFSLDNPPIINEKTGARGKPGDEINCNCYMEPVISFDNKG